MWETPVKPGQTDALVKYVMAEVWPGVTGAKGFMGGEISALTTAMGSGCSC